MAASVDWHGRMIPKTDGSEEEISWPKGSAFRTHGSPQLGTATWLRAAAVADTFSDTRAATRRGPADAAAVRNVPYRA